MANMHVNRSENSSFWKGAKRSVPKGFEFYSFATSARNCPLSVCASFLPRLISADTHVLFYQDFSPGGTEYTGGASA